MSRRPTLPHLAPADQQQRAHAAAVLADALDPGVSPGRRVVGYFEALDLAGQLEPELLARLKAAEPDIAAVLKATIGRFQAGPFVYDVDRDGRLRRALT